MDGKGLSNLKAVTIDVGKVGEVHTKATLSILPFIFSDDVGFIVILNLGEVEQVFGRVASACATEIPVAEGDLLFLRTASLLGGRRW